MYKTIFTVIVTLVVTIFTAATYIAIMAVDYDNTLFLNAVEVLYEGEEVTHIIGLCALDDYAEIYPKERGRVDQMFCQYLRDVSPMNDTTHVPSRNIEARLCRELLFDHPRYKHQEYDLSGVDFIGCDLSRFDFSGCNLAGAGFHQAELVGCSFAGAVLARADFYLANCLDADFTGAVTFRADMRYVEEGSDER